MLKRRWKAGLAVITAAAMLVSGVAVPSGTSAAGKMKLNKKKVTIKVGQKVKLKLKRAKGKVKWKSTKKKVASVTGKGLVKGKKAGTARIIAKCKGKSFSCKVTVKKKGGGSSDLTTPEATATLAASASPVPSATVSPGTSARPTSSPSASASPNSSAGPSGMPTQSAGPGASVEPGQSSAPVVSTEPEASIEPGQSSAPIVSTEPGASIEPGQSSEPGASIEPGQSSEPGVSIEPSQSSEPVVSSEPGASIEPGQSSQPGASIEPNQSSAPETSVEPSQSSAPEVSASPEQSAVPTVSSKPPVNKDAVTFQIACTDARLGTDTDRSWTFAIGDSLADMQAQFANFAPDTSDGEKDEYLLRSEKIPQGYTAYVCRPYGYKGLYFQIYTDGDQVVGMAAISRYFQLKDKDGNEIVSSFGVSETSLNNASGLSGNGFATGYKYTNALFKSTADYHVAAFVDPFGGHQVIKGGVYGIQVFATADASGNSISAKNVFETSEIFKKGGYTAQVNEAQGKELSEWAAAFRQIELVKSVQGKSDIADNDGFVVPVAQIHSEALAQQNSSNPETDILSGEKARICSYAAGKVDLEGYLEDNNLSQLRDRLLYGYIFPTTKKDKYFTSTYFTAEAVGNGSPDALGYLTWQLEDSGAGGTYADLLKTELGTRDEFNEFYVVGGFASASSGSNFTYATLDMIGHGVDL